MKGSAARYGFNSGALRVARAEEHLTNLRGVIGQFTSGERYRFRPKYDPNPPHGLVGISGPKTIVIPTIGALLIGEICYNLRCALDYLVAALAILDSRKRRSGTQFPFESCENIFRQHEDTFLAGVNKTHRAMIEEYQPYKGCTWSAILRNLSNMDKHNEFVRITAQASINLVPLRDDGKSWGTYVRRAPHTVFGKEVDMGIDVAINILFPDGRVVVETLEEIKSGVAQAFADFDPEFPR
jgi:hypothetical protein